MRVECLYDGRDLCRLLDKALDGEHDIVLELDLRGVQHELEERLQGFLNRGGEPGEEAAQLANHSEYVPALINEYIVPLALLMAPLEFEEDPRDQRLHEGDHILPDVLMVVLHEILQETEV